MSRPSSLTAPEDRVRPLGPALYRQSPQSKEIRDYFASIRIQYSDDWKWKVHLGDVIAVSMTSSLLSLEDIEQWEPQHLRKASKHWKIGLVVALVQDQNLEMKCHVEWLEKALDLPAKIQNELKGSFRPYTSPSQPFKLPHVLLRTLSIQEIRPQQILPVQITLLTDAQFKHGVTWDPISQPEDRYSFRMHCPKSLVRSESPDNDPKDPSWTTTTVDPMADAWASLNASAFCRGSQHNSHGNNKSNNTHIPWPLQQAWVQWQVIEQDMELLPALMNGFGSTTPSKGQEYRNFKNWQLKLQKVEEDQENKLPSEKIAGKKNHASTKTSKKRGIVASTEAATPQQKRIRIHEPQSSTKSQATTAATTAKSAQIKRAGGESVKSILKTATTSAKSKTATKGSVKSKAPSTNTNTNTKKTKTKSRVHPSTPSTKYSSASSRSISPPGRDPIHVVESSATMIYSGSVSKTQYNFYSELEIQHPQNRQRRTIQVGQVVAVAIDHDHESGVKIDTEPFSYPWRVAQILAIWHPKQTQKRTSQPRWKEEWTMQVRWLLRHSELTHQLQSKLLLKKYFKVQQGLLETNETANVSLDMLLPVPLEISSSGSSTKPFPEYPSSDFHNNSAISLQCCYFLSPVSLSILYKQDWDEMSTGSRSSSSELKGPLKRGMQAMQLTDRIRQAYTEELASRIALECTNSTAGEGSSVMMIDSDNMEEDTSSSLGSLPIESVAKKPILEKWGMLFHDAMRIGIDKNTLVEGGASFQPGTSYWTVQVGYVVPIAVEQDSDVAIPRKNQRQKQKWFPFCCPWSPAQIVAIYQDSTTQEWEIQVRWFHRFDELLEGQKAGLRELNKPHVLFETETFDILHAGSCLPGRIILTSAHHDAWEVSKSDITGLPLIPRYCAHICLDEEIDESPDWTDYDVLLPTCPRPLTRGLLVDPFNRPHKNWILMLCRRYTREIRKRGNDPDEYIMKQWSGTRTVAPYLSKGSVEFDEGKIVVELGDVVPLDEASNARRRFALNLNVRVPPEYFAVGKKMRATKYNVNIGDVVAYHNKDAGQRSDHVLMKHLRYPWYPFSVPWSCGQILSIRCEGSSSSSPLVEVRSFYRRSEIPPEIHHLCPIDDDEQREQIFESDHVTDLVSAARILGTVNILPERHSKVSKLSRNDKGKESLVSCPCHFFFKSKLRRFQPIFFNTLTPKIWLDRHFDRGMSLSRWQQDVTGLKEATVSKMKRNVEFDVRKLLIAGTDAEVGAKGIVETSSDDSDGSVFFTGAALLPQWERFEDSELHFPSSDRANVTWNIKVGDFLAVRDESSSLLPYFPFNKAWKPCQLVAIYSSGSSKLEDLVLEVRYFDFKEMTNVKELDLPELTICGTIHLGTESYLDVLGPLSFVNRCLDSAFDWSCVPRKIPCGLLYTDMKLPALETSMAVSSIYTKHARAKVLAALDKDCPGRSIEMSPHTDTPDSCDIRTVGSAIYFDVSKLQAFYNEILLSILIDAFDPIACKKQQGTWNVKMGDIVLIQCDGPKRYPMTCNWGVAEIVAIWKEYGTRDDLEKDMHVSTDERGRQSTIKTEIRWFYERRDFVALSDDVEIDEVFETDDVIVLDDLTTILAPANLYSDHVDIIAESMGLPVQNFWCRRFWSTRRKSLIPCGDLAGREGRARLYSKAAPRGLPFAKVSGTDKDALALRFDWKESLIDDGWVSSIKQILKKLNLKDASKGAYDNGETLIGREKEISQLLSFFRAAIRGQPGPGGIRSSMFIAGAPGVGKTASIRSVISRLKLEQARGDLPTFNFIPLNGMELHHPFEAYVKLLEAITNQKHVGSHEKACQRLEYHFTNPKALKPGVDRSITAVLLDEIDYLVTEKQSVLYNFFDWPKRAAAVPNGHRLVVVGISNTLNLTEQLIPSVQSRVGSERIVFKAYGVKEATAILKAKISEASPDHEIFNEPAIQFAAKKTAAMSGDIRKAFQICRGAAEAALRKYEEGLEKESTGSNRPYPIVGISDVSKVSRESFDSSLVNVVSYSTPFQALLLVSLVSLCRTTGREVGGFDMVDILTKMQSLSDSSGDPMYTPAPSFGETILLLNSLSEANLVKLRTATASSMSYRSSGGAWPVTTLVVDEHTIVRGLKGTVHKALAEKNLPQLF